MRRKLGALTAASSLAFLLSGCAAPQPIKHGSHNKAREALADMVSDYENNEAAAFFEHFDSDSISNFENFRDNIRQFLIHNHQFNISMIIDTVLKQGTETSVQAHWDRGYINQTGVSVKDSGRCEMIFRKNPSKGLVLTAIHGDSPF